MDPPAYASTRPPLPHRSIQDLRSQILANGSILKPRANTDRPSDDHLELVVAKIPLPAQSSSGMSEKQALAGNHVNVGTAGPSSSVSGQHYGILIQRSYTRKDVKIIVKGQPKETVEEALEWLLERTETEIHELVVKHGRTVGTQPECCVM